MCVCVCVCICVSGSVFHCLCLIGFILALFYSPAYHEGCPCAPCLVGGLVPTPEEMVKLVRPKEKMFVSSNIPKKLG